MSDDDQLAKHPYFAVTGPGGCTFCFMDNVTFAVNTPPEEMHRLLNFNFSCLTRLLPCKYLEDIYPAAEPWHRFDGTIGGRPVTKDTPVQTSTMPANCSIPVFARGRETYQILRVTSLSLADPIKEDGGLEQLATVRLDETLKGPPFGPDGAVLKVWLIAHSWSSPVRIDVPLEPGKAYLLLLPTPGNPTSAPIPVDRCLALPDSAENRAALIHRSSLSETLRTPDARPTWFMSE